MCVQCLQDQTSHKLAAAPFRAGNSIPQALVSLYGMISFYTDFASFSMCQPSVHVPLVHTSAEYSCLRYSMKRMQLESECKFKVSSCPVCCPVQEHSEYFNTENNNYDLWQRKGLPALCSVLFFPFHFPLFPFSFR